MISKHVQSVYAATKPKSHREGAGDFHAVDPGKVHGVIAHQLDERLEPIPHLDREAPSGIRECIDGGLKRVDFFNREASVAKFPLVFQALGIFSQQSLEDDAQVPVIEVATLEAAAVDGVEHRLLLLLQAVVDHGIEG